MAILGLASDIGEPLNEAVASQPIRLAVGAKRSSALGSQLAERNFTLLASVDELRDELAAERVGAPALLLLRGTVATAVGELLRLRELPGLARVPILCVLADGLRDDLRTCERASAFACLREPVSTLALAAAIEAGLASTASFAAPQVANSLVRSIELCVRLPNQVETAVAALAELCPEPNRQGLGLAELIMNAIEHGNLEISGSQKAELLLRGGFEGELARRLTDPRYAGRDARLRLTRYPDHVEIVIEDAGPGFDWRAQLEKVIDFEAPCGRGLRLAQQLSFDSLEYLGRGNVAIARVRHEATSRGGMVGISDWERRTIEMRAERLLDRLREAEFFRSALALCLEISESTQGLLGYLDNFSGVVLPACVSDALTAGDVPSISRDSWPTGWHRTLKDGSAHVSDDGLSLPVFGKAAHAEPTLSVPVVQGGRIFGFVLLVGAPNGYTGLDAERIEIALSKLVTVFVAQVEAALAWSARLRLEESAALAQQEQHTAAHMMQCLLGNTKVDSDVRFFSNAKEVFNGDLVLSERLPDGNLRALVADFVGHGLAAAIGGLPLSSIFHATARKQVPLSEVVTTMNDALRGFLPPSYFCGAILLEIDVRRRRLEFWNGGMPSSLLWRASSGELTLLSSCHLPLGVVHSAQLGTEPTTVPIAGGDQILLLSDGITESLGASGELFGVTGVEQALRQRPTVDAFDAVVDALADFSDLLTQSTDDASLIRLRVGSAPLAAE